MTAGGVIPHHEDHKVCVCGQPIKPCPVQLGPGSLLCHGYIHADTITHQCKGRPGSLAEPAGEVTHVSPSFQRDRIRHGSGTPDPR